MVKEIKRKLFHFLSAVYASGFYFLGREAVLKILVPILAVEGMIEAVRLFSPSVNAKLMFLFGGIHREDEMHRFSGIFWTLAGSVLTILLFKDRNVVLCSMGYLIFSDAAAALVGVPFGRHKYLGKSLEGSAACFTASLLVGLAFLNPPLALLTAMLVTVVEFLPLPWNDNLWIPTLSGCFLTFKSIIL